MSNIQRLLSLRHNKSQGSCLWPSEAILSILACSGLTFVAPQPHCNGRVRIRVRKTFIYEYGKRLGFSFKHKEQREKGYNVLYLRQFPIGCPVQNPIILPR
jgi:hypothetical protein